MLNFYEKYNVIIFSVLCLVTLSLSIYFYINRNRRPWFSYYWKGFLLMFISVLSVLLKLMIVFPTTFNVIRKLISTVIALCGFYLILRGAKIEKISKRDKNKGSLKQF